jgi:hypothetical protein
LNSSFISDKLFLIHNLILEVYVSP